MNVLEDCIILLYYTRCLGSLGLVLFLSFDFISFHGRILSRYSEINNFKRLKFQKITKTYLKNAGFKGNLKYKEAVCFTGYSL